MLQSAATVETGATTTVNLTLEVGVVREQVTVRTDAPTLSYESSNVSGVVNRGQVENLPLNGRNFLELAKLEPDVPLTPPVYVATESEPFIIRVQ